LAGKQAKILSEDDLEDLLVYAAATRNSIRNRVIVLLSAKAGLRAGEIANLTLRWSSDRRVQSARQ
jgi:integrase